MLAYCSMIIDEGVYITVPLTSIILKLQVGMKLIWSSKSQKCIGHAMTHDELATLCDVYTVLKPDYMKDKHPSKPVVMSLGYQ